MRAGLVLGLSALLGLWGCGSDGGDDKTPPPPDGAGGADANTPLADAGPGGTLDAGGPTVSLDGGDAATSLDAHIVVTRDGSLAPTGTLSWKPCAGKFECAILYVPLDYTNTSGESVKLAISRHKATGTRVGALLLNPGGPGSSAIDFLEDFIDLGTPQLIENFDLVVFDPRGVGFSTPIDCHSTLQQLVAADPSPDNEAEWKAVDDASATFAAECATKYPAILPHLGTLNVARDMDRVREALGEEKVEYLGFSYGTAIGARYADLFADRVGQLVLDGAVDLHLSALDFVLEQAKGFETALANYFVWCKAAANNCAWTGASSPEQALFALEERVESTVIPAPGADRPVGPGELLLGITASLYYGRQGWEVLSGALEQAVSGDGTTIINLVDQYHQRQIDGSYTNIEEVFSAVSCIDQAAPTVEQVRAAAPRFLAEAPNFGLASLTSLLVCSHWPVHGEDIPPPKGKGAPPLLVIGTTGDPATPYAWAQRMAADLESAKLLTYQGEGHTGFGKGDVCIDSAVVRYLLDGTLPESGCGSAPKNLARIVGPVRRLNIGR
jgi:pimeloyl-ACP methyl ester carboxylesterase